MPGDRKGTSVSVGLAPTIIYNKSHFYYIHPNMK